MSEHLDQSSASSPRPLWLAIVGAVIGGVVGYFLFITLLKQFGVYVMVVPGALIGIGRVTGSTAKSMALGIACGIAALIVSLLTEWSVTPMEDGAGFVDFLRGLPDKPFRNQASIIAGAAMALWFGMGRDNAEQETVEGPLETDRSEERTDES